MSQVRAFDVAKLAAIALVVLAGPTAGDIGSCGQDAELLDEDKFFQFKQGTDCRQCAQCQILTDACVQACGDELVEAAFPVDCFPFVHDGEVCLNKLASASCDEYVSYMADFGATAPTECNFCPPREGGQGGEGGDVDVGIGAGGAATSSGSGGGAIVGSGGAN